MTKMTKLEQAVYDAINAVLQDSVEVDLQDICLETDMETSRARGVVASLIKKGLVVSEVSERNSEEVVTYQTRTIEEAEAEMATRVVAPAKEKKVTKASLMREQIAAFKQTMTKEEAQAHIIQWAMETLGQSKQLAKVYFTENWYKV